MKILLVNKFHYLKGGSEKYYFDLAKLLKEHGHEVAFFSMQDEKNIKTDCKEYFVENSDMNSKNIFKALDVIYSKKNKKAMEKALDDFKPDIVHLNNFQRQLSASIIKPIKKRNIPIVFTAHDLQAICPAIVMLDNEKNICDKCINGKYMNCIKGKCIKNSSLKSLLGAIEGKYYRNKKIYPKQIDKIITPSEFYKEKLEEDGIKSEKIEALHNFIDIDDYNVKIEDEGYALYYGRIIKEKGVLNLIKAFKNIKNYQLYIAGDGPDIEKVKKYIKDNKLEDKIKLLGFLNSDEVKEYVRKARFIVVPSVWYENCPYSVLETLVMGKPIIGSNLGGIPELVKDNENGLIYKYNDIKELGNKMQELFDNKEKAMQLGKVAKENAKKDFSKELYYNKIMDVYKEVLKNK